MKKLRRKITAGPESDVVVNEVGKRLRKGLNTNIFIIGLSGTGKSSTSLRLAELITDQRKAESGEEHEIFIIDSLLELLKAIRSSKPGGVIIAEEVSVLFGSRRAMAKENVSIGKVLDTCRKRRLTIISNAPIWKSIDSHMRGMGHLIVETLKINQKEKIVVSKFHRLQTNPGSGKTYKHTMKRAGRDVSRMYTRMPTAEKWAKYEKQKDQFMDELYHRLEREEITKRKKEDKANRVMGDEVKGLTKQEIEVHYLIHKKGKTQREVAKEMGISPSRVSQVYLKLLEKTKKDEPEKAK